jgi:hypothetical protein
LAVTCSPSNAPPHQPPVSNRGALFESPNWRFFRRIGPTERLQLELQLRLS